MATNNVTIVGNILDVLQFQLPDKTAINTPVNSLVEVDHMSMDLPALGANMGSTHHGLRTVALPTGYLVSVGGSWKSSKAQFEPYVFGTMELHSSYEWTSDTYKKVPKAVAQAQIKAQVDAHWHGLSQGAMNILLYGHSAPNLTAVVGLTRMAPYTTYDNQFCFSVGGSGSNLRSAWLLKPGIDTVFKLYDKNDPMLGIVEEEKPEQRIDGLGTGTDEHNWLRTIEFALTTGICIHDQTACKRICNIPVDPSAYPGEDVAYMAIQASIINATKQPGMSNGLGNASEPMNTWMLYCDEQVYAKMILGANMRTNVRFSPDNIYKTSLPMIGENIIVRRMDALNHALGSGETAVASA